MAELIVLGLFAAGLVLCVALGQSVLYALFFGYLVFFSYGLHKKRRPAELFKMSWSGVRTIAPLLLVFMLIGVLTGVWRQCGTIACIVYEACALIRPEVIILASFLLTCLLSLLTGTAFGTVATMGVICMTIANAAGASVFWTGGAILAGCFFGDRCSPMSTSALLVCRLTGTDIYDNIRGMLKTGLLPFLISCGAYLLIGLTAPCGSVSPEVRALFAEHFSLHWTTLIPAALIVALALFRVEVKYAMLASIAAGCAVCLFTQGVGLPELLRCCVLGYSAPEARLGAMMNGGGLVSMLSTAAIVCLSSSYAGIFDGTGLLDGVKAKLEGLSGALTPFGTVAAASLVTCAISCNQTLASMLTHQLCREEMPDAGQLALAMEDTVIVMAALIPWSIAAAVPLSALGAPMTSILAAFFLYLLPLCSFFRYVRGRKKAAVTGL